MGKIIDPLAIAMGEWSSSITLGSIFFRLGVTFIFSIIIGCERSSKRHSAGLRTFMILYLATTISGMLDMFLFESFGFSFAVISALSVVACAILSLKSVFLSSKNQIRGLTTSFTLWESGLVGIAVGFGFYTIALVGFIISLCSLSAFPALERYLKNRSNHFEIYLELTNQNCLKEFVSIIRKLGLKIDDIEFNSAYENSGLSVYSISLTVISKELKKYKTHKEIIEAISSLDYVQHIEEMV